VTVGRRGAIVLAGVLAVAMSLLSGPVGAQTPSDKTKVDQQIDATKAQVDTATAEEQRLLGLIDASSARKAALDAKVASFDSQIAVVQRQLDTAQSKLSALDAQQRVTEGRLAGAKEALGAAKDELGRQAIGGRQLRGHALQLGQPRGPGVEALLHAGRGRVPDRDHRRHRASP
jgi:septal ring factor EnvC (AmiA/AmiB activator)